MEFTEKPGWGVRHSSGFVPVNRETNAITRKTKHVIFASVAAIPTSRVKPNTAAMSAMARKAVAWQIIMDRFNGSR